MFGMQPEQHFRLFLERMVDRTQTAAIARHRDGQAAEQAISDAIDDAVDRHHRNWERNLVKVWGTLSSGELEEVCSAINTRNQAAFQIYSERVGEHAKRANQPVLEQAGTEVLMEIF